MSVVGSIKEEVNSMNPSMKPTLNLAASSVEGVSRGQLNGRRNLRRDEVSQDRNQDARITRRQHQPSFQDFASPSVQPHNEQEATMAPSPGNNVIGNTLRVVRRVLEEGRAVLKGSPIQGFHPGSIEHELSCFVENLAAAGVRCEVSAIGHRREFTRPVQECVNLIAREALGHAFRHSGASHIEAEIEYSARQFRLIVRDNGRGIASAEACNDRDLHGSLLHMSKQAENIGARLTVWSRPGAGTEVEISLPCHLLADACA
jgi:signal transduction histidine kinase